MKLEEPYQRAELICGSVEPHVEVYALTALIGIEVLWMKRTFQYPFENI